MKPKNSKERKISFLKFFGLFALTATMIVMAVFFSYNVQKKETTLLREEVKLIKAGVEFQNNFYDEMKEVKGLIDSLDVPGQNTNFLKSQINDKLVVLQKTIPTQDDATDLYDMHSAIVNLYVDLTSAKDKLHSLRDAEATIDEYKNAYDECSRELKAAERELRIR